MLPFILGLGGKLLARPAVLVGLIGAGTLTGFAVYHVKVIDGARERYIERLEMDIVTKAATIANQQIAISQERLNVSTLTATVNEQNASIDALEQKARAAQNAAAVSALRALEEGRKAAEALRKPESNVPPGNEAMNAWLEERFGGAP